jgi:hypothetical protein
MVKASGAEIARERADHGASNSQQYGEHLERETREAMIALSASAHAIDGFYGDTRQMIDVPAATVEKWKENGTKRPGRILETLKTGFAIGSHASRWAGELQRLHDLRDAALHHNPSDHPPSAHPGGYTETSKEVATYTREAAVWASDLALEILTTCLTSPRESNPEIKVWAERMAHVPDALRAFAARP